MAAITSTVKNVQRLVGEQPDEDQAAGPCQRDVRERDLPRGARRAGVLQRRRRVDQRRGRQHEEAREVAHVHEPGQVATGRQLERDRGVAAREGADPGADQQPGPRRRPRRWGSRRRCGTRSTGRARRRPPRSPPQCPVRDHHARAARRSSSPPHGGIGAGPAAGASRLRRRRLSVGTPASRISWMTRCWREGEDRGMSPIGSAGPGPTCCRKASSPAGGGVG